MNVQSKRTSCVSFRRYTIHDNCTPENRHLMASRLVVEVTTGRFLPLEVADLIYEMIFSSKEWVSHQLRNPRENEQIYHFLGSTKRNRVCIEDIIGKQPRKKRWTLMVKDISGDSNRPLGATKQRSSGDIVKRKERAATGSSAEQRLSNLASKPAQSLQGLLTTSGPSIYPITGTSTSSRTYEGSCLFEDLKDRPITPPDLVELSRSLSSKPERDCRSSKYCPSVTAD